LKTYRSAPKLLAQIEQLLAANKPSFHHSPLDDVIEIMGQGRHYSWMGIYFAIEENRQQLLGASAETSVEAPALPNTRSKIVVAIKIASRKLGVLVVESDRENAFSPAERVLLKRLAVVLARFLTGRGKYIVRKTRETVAASRMVDVPARRPQPASEGKRSISAAVGEK
jgi:hypothetical protein